MSKGLNKIIDWLMSAYVKETLYGVALWFAWCILIAVAIILISGGR
jgi:putative copper export protein